MSKPNDTLLPVVEGFLKVSGMADRRFGIGAVNDPNLVHDMRKGRRLWPETADKVRAFIARGGEPIPDHGRTA